MRSHSHGDLVCEHPTKALCSAARREAMGKCAAMTDDKEPTPCSHWATSMVGERGYCGTHAGSILNATIERERAARKKTLLDERIDTYMTWRDEHPSVWDTRHA